MNTVIDFLWLVMGAGTQLLGFGRWMTPFAAWLTPICLLHFAHGAPPLVGTLWVWPALALAMAFSLRGVVPIPGAAYLLLPVFWGLLATLPYAADRLFAPLLPGVWATLMFPTAWVALEFLVARVNPYGTWGAIGYTQHGVLPLMQLASVTGIWGIGFLIAWFASVVNWAWDRQFDWSLVQHGILAWSAVGGAALLFGGARVALAPDHRTVRVAGVGWPKGLVEAHEFMRAVAPDLTGAEREKLQHAFARVQDSFLSRSEREARAGAKIIVWPEANLMIFQEDEAAFLRRAATFARDHGVYLVMGFATLRPAERYTFRNHAVLLTPAGDTAYDYTKITAVPGFEKQFSLPGQSPIPIANTEYGRVASPICFDMDFHSVIRQVGRGRADMMLVPASDWKAIVSLHQVMAEARAVENGVALFRITRWGGSGAVDPYGRRLAWMDDFSTDDNVMVAHVPVQAGRTTPYVLLGDTFAWACVAGLVIGIGTWLTR